MVEHIFSAQHIHDKMTLDIVAWLWMWTWLDVKFNMSVEIQVTGIDNSILYS